MNKKNKKEKVEVRGTKNILESMSGTEALTLLKSLNSDCIINIADIWELEEMKKRQELLDMHPYEMWQGKNGKWYTYLPDNQKGRVQRERTTQKAIESLVVDYWRKQEENPTIENVFTEWNDRRLKNKAISKATHLRNKQIFDRFYSSFGKKRIKTVTSDEFADFLEEQIAKYNLTAKAFSNLKSITKHFLIRAKKRKLINYSVEELFYDLDVSDSSFRKVIKEDYEEVFDDKEMNRMMEYLMENLDTKNIGILLMFLTGIRVGELVTLKHSDFDGNICKIRRTETRYLTDDGYVYDVKEFPKSAAGVRNVIIPDDYKWLCDKISALNPDGEFIFTDDTGKRMTTNCFRRREERNCKKLGIFCKSPHKIRKTYGSILLDNNVDKRLIEDVMGHSNISVTEGHYHRNRKTIDRKSIILSSIPEFQSKDAIKNA